MLNIWKFVTHAFRIDFEAMAVAIMHLRLLHKKNSFLDGGSNSLKTNGFQGNFCSCFYPSSTLNDFLHSYRTGIKSDFESKIKANKAKTD